ncbi:ATP-grasp domain-containing protein [Sphingomonas abietis]|uniref:Alpha-L-glutamate ligase n=1 Tax=Sphingomonas abietis TaxID=3012344 RepID=A0ABY7NT38_9SPHN|nr:alpha-L-glutamate ligase [Sphingomonas abietis]WBO23737.1 alpha-L-glutamate ligase [Sphingomonas abietis]
MTDLAILYEHPFWFEPLFGALSARGISAQKIHADGLCFDPSSAIVPAPLVFNRIAMSSFLRAPEHPIFFARSLLAHWQRLGARVLNGVRALETDASKASQLSLIAGLGHGIPATRVVHRRADLISATQGLRWPLVVKANIGGSGAGIMRYDDLAALEQAVATGAVPDSIDRVLLVQEYVPVRGGAITRIETLGGRYLYAIEVDGGGAFDLCPADACLVDGKPSIMRRAAEPDPAIIDAAERIVQAAGIDVGGVEMMIDDRDGVPRFYDINALSNFVAKPLDILGWDPHERLVDWLVQRIADAKA